MFGQNNNTPTDTNNNQSNPAPMPTNPFGSNDAPVPPQPDLPAAQPVPAAAPAPEPSNPTLNPAPSAGGDDLLGLKQQALQQLQPLVSHLDQSPEEKFKTTMMMIQATDNPTLVQQAYELANQISDEKSRAQALLDVVNEINYFTNKNNAESKG